MHACHFCQKPQLTSPGFKQCYLGQFFLEPQNPSVPHLEEEEDAKEGKVVVDYKWDVDYEQERGDSHDEPDAQEEEQEETPQSVQRSCQETFRWQTVHHQVQDLIQCVHAT